MGNHSSVEEHCDSEVVSDGSLVRQYRDGNESAATNLYRRYAHRLRRLAWLKALRGAGRSLDADDIVQSVFRRFFTAARNGDYEVPAGEDLWKLLMVITLNRIRKEEEFVRSAKRDVRRTVSAEAMTGGVPAMVARENETAAFMRVVLDEALSRMPADHAAAVRARMEGYDVAEIAERLGRSKRTVERILHEAKTALRATISEW